LARKLVPSVPRPGGAIAAIPGEGFVDVETTRSLWENTFRAPKSIASRTLWVDRPSSGIPFLYIRTALGLSAALSQRGMSDEAARISAQAGMIARATQLESLLADTGR
jgi:hypothetical protein